MDWITDDIAIGNYLEAVDVKVLRQFRSVLSLIPILSDLRQLKKSTLVELREMHEDLEETAYCRLIQEVRAELESKRFEVVELIDGPGNDRRVFQRAIETLPNS